MYVLILKLAASFQQNSLTFISTLIHKPRDFTFNDSTSQRGNFVSLKNCFCYKICVSLHVAQWVKIRPTDPKVPCSIIAANKL